jgi:hypothetical protein
MNVNIVNCYYKPGPATPSSRSERIIAIDKNKITGTEVYNTWGKFYISGNAVAGSQRTTDDNWTYGVYAQYHNSYGTVPESEKLAMRLTNPLPINNNVTTHNAVIAYDRVLDFAGASLKRDAVDTRIIGHVKNGTFTAPGSNGSVNGIIDTQGDVGGWPVLNSTPPAKDSDSDGMPDDWEKIMGLDPLVPNANAKTLSTAYDNIEVYTHSLVKTISEDQIK